MAAFTTQRAGNWSDTTTSSPWYVSGATPCPIPGNGDTAVVAHNVTVDQDVTVGRSAQVELSGTGTISQSGTTVTGSSTAFSTELRVGDAIGVSGKGRCVVRSIASDISMTVSASRSVSAGTAFTYTPQAIYIDSVTLTTAAGKQLTVRGDLNFRNAFLTMNAGSILEMDASQASTPSTALYRIQTGIEHNINGIITVNGSSGSHCIIRSNAGGGNARIAGGEDWLLACILSATYCDFSRIGDASHDGFSFRLSYANPVDTFILSHCTLTACGRISSVGAPANASILSLSNVVMSSSAGTTCMTADWSGTSTRTMDHCSFDQIVQFYSPSGATITNNYFGGGFGTTAANWGSFTGNAMVSNTDFFNCYGNVSDCYFIHLSANGHGLGMKSAGNQTFDGIIFDYTNGGTVGDAVAPGPSGAYTFTFQNCILLPQSSNESPGKFVSMLGLDGTYASSIVTNHNTVCTTDAQSNLESGVLNFGEAGAGKAGMITELKSNIAWTPSGKNPGAVLVRYVGGVQDAVAAANADYNGKNDPATTGYGGTGATSGPGYISQDSTAPCTGTCGAHDVTGDPRFVDSTRNLAKWGQTTQGADGTVAGALAKIAANPALIYDTGNPNALWQWVRAGFAPRNGAYANAGHDAVTIGAVEGVSPDTPTGLAVDPGAGIATVACDDMAGAAGYRWYVDGVLAADTVAATADLTGLSAGDLSFTVTAYSAFGESAASGAVVATITSASHPGTSNPHSRRHRDELAAQSVESPFVSGPPSVDYTYVRRAVTTYREN